MRLSELFSEISYREQTGALPLAGEREIEEIHTDPRRVCAATVFVCTVTPLHDGHFFADAAYEAGCRVFVAERGLALPPDATVLVVEDTARVLPLLAARCYGHPSRSMTVLAVGGTHGKTTTALLAATLLARAGYRVGAVTSDGVLLGEERRAPLPIVPDGADIQRTLADFLANGVEVAILEVSAYQLARHTLDALSLAAVALPALRETPPARRRAFRSQEEEHRAVLSLLCLGAPLCFLPAELAEYEADGRVVTLGDGGEIVAKNSILKTEKANNGMSFALCYQGVEASTLCRIPAPFGVEDALAAAALCLTVGMELQSIAAHLPEVAVRGTLEPLLQEEAMVLTDRAFDAAALERALRALRPFARGRLAVLIGSVGGRARERRAPLGRAALRYADYVYFTADDPDAEDPLEICREMIGEARDDGRFTVIADRGEAIRRAVCDLRAGDLLLLAGKGGEDRQLINGCYLPFSERELVAKAAKAHR